MIHLSIFILPFSSSYYSFPSTLSLASLSVLPSLSLPYPSISPFLSLFLPLPHSLSLSLSSIPPQVPHGAISLNMFKLYLGRILGTCPKDYSDEAAKSGPLVLYQHEPRTAVARILVSTPDLGKAGPYIPVFYQECPPIRPGPNSDVSVSTSV